MAPALAFYLRQPSLFNAISGIGFHDLGGDCTTFLRLSGHTINRHHNQKSWKMIELPIECFLSSSAGLIPFLTHAGWPAIDRRPAQETVMKATRGGRRLVDRKTPLTTLKRSTPTMAEYKLKNCPECGQKLRFPQDIGGMLMKCPSCGRQFQSDFTMCVTGKRVNRSLLKTIFELPDTILKRIGRYFYSR
jgi:DNA-directed RNA polymerase subunit RPC12/RpoP